MFPLISNFRLSSLICAVLLFSSSAVPVVESSILFAGDSDIELWKKTNKLYPNSVNKGDGGTTCKQWINRIGKLVDKFTPTTTVLVCGENDMAEGRSPQEAFEDFRKVVKTITSNGSQVIYMGTKPEPSTKGLHTKYRQYDALIRDYYTAEQQEQQQDTMSSPSFVMVDVYPSFEMFGNPKSLYSNDRLHLSNKKNSGGYSYWNDWLVSALSSNDCVLWNDGLCARALGDVVVEEELEPETTSPTSSSSTSVSSSSTCQDDAEFRFMNKKKKDCSWVGEKNKCGKKYKGKKLWESCPYSCGDC